MTTRIDGQQRTQTRQDTLVGGPRDASAAAALARLARDNTKAGSVSGAEMAEMISNATRDPDNQAAGREYDAIRAWVGKHGKLLSPEAKRVFQVYAAECDKARAAGQTGIDFRAYNKLTRDMQAAARPDYKDRTTAEQLRALADGNTRPGSISGKEMAEAILNGTKDADGHAASKELSDIAKFVRENDKLLSPEAKKVFDLYQKTARAAQAKGETGIPLEAYNRMARDMMRASGPSYKDQSAAAQLTELARDNTRPGSISGKEMVDAIIKGTADLDGESARKEFSDISKFVRENQQLLSPEAKAAFEVYQRYAKAAQAKGKHGIDLRDFMKMQVEMQKAGGARYGDVSAAAALRELATGNTQPGSISGRELTEAIIKGIKDPDNAAAGQEYRDIARFVQENGRLLSPEAKKAFEVYQRYVIDAQVQGRTGLSPESFLRLQAEMQQVGGPSYGDKSAGQALEALLSSLGGKPGATIDARSMMDAIINGTRDLDGQAAGTEFKDVAKFVRENANRLSPEAKQIFEVYEKYVKTAQKAGHPGLSLGEFWRMQLDMGRIAEPRVTSTATASQLPALGQSNPTGGAISGRETAGALANGLADLRNLFGSLAALGAGNPDTAAAVRMLLDLSRVLGALEALQSAPAQGLAGSYNDAVTQAPNIGTPSGPANIQELLQKVLEQLQQMLGGSHPGVPAPTTPASSPGATTLPPPPVVRPPFVPYLPRHDSGAHAAIDALKAGNTKPGSISGQEMTEAIIKGTADLDNEAARNEFAEFSRFVRDNGKLLSPEARKAFEIYERHARAAQARGQSGLPLSDYLKMQMELRASSGPVYQDRTAAEQLKALAKGNTAPGSISGKEMVDAIVQGTIDRDGQAAGKEFQDISKFVRENEQLLSPEAKQAFEIYQRHARDAQARGQSGIDLRDFARMQTELQRVGTPAYQDKSAAQTLTQLVKDNPKPGSISGSEMTDAIVKATRDPDNQAAGREYQDLARFVRENDKLLSPEAKRAFAVYERHAKAAQARGQTGIPTTEFLAMQTEMRVVGQPQYQDVSAGQQLRALAKGNTRPGSISGQELTDAIIRGTRDLDGQAAGREYQDIAKFVRENEQLLSPEAKAAFAVYERTAKAAKGSGIDQRTFARMQAEMQRVSRPGYQDASVSRELKTLAARNRTPGSVSAQELTNAILRGTRDLDNQAAGREYQDVAKFVRENEQLLSPQAKKAFAVYEKYAKAAQARGQQGIPLDQYAKMAREMQYLAIARK